MLSSWPVRTAISALVINFVMLTVISRLLTPEEIGVSVIGIGVMAVVLSIGQFATCDFLIQRKEVTAEDVRTSSTVILGLTALTSAGLVALAPWCAAFYGKSELGRFLEIVAVANLLAAVAAPATALLRRGMAFGRLAVINVATALVTAAVTVILAVLGFSSMSFAWAVLGGTATTAMLALVFHPEPGIYRPCLRSWRGALTFGGYNGALAVLRNGYESLPQLFLGGILPLNAVGLYNRSNTISSVPDKFILSGVFAVAFPALAAQVREGRSLQRPYLDMLGHITVVYWPALILLALLAHPVVGLLLGAQWAAAVPLVQMIALACVAFFPAILTSPVLLAMGATRDNFLASLITLPISGAVFCLFGLLGVEAMAASQFLIIPFQTYVALRIIRRHVPFTWGDLLAAVRKSAGVTLCSIVGPLSLIAAHGFDFDLSIAASLLAGALAALGWIGGLRLFRHPMLREVESVLGVAARSAGVRRVLGAPRRMLQHAVIRAG